MSGVRHTRSGAAGFTLVELMVALTGGLFVSLAVFALARDSGRFYQREARIANATIGGLLGFERLRSDIARAGFMSSPNIKLDPRQCGKPDGLWPNNLRNLASIQVSAAAIVYPTLTANGRTPPQVLLAGAYTSSDLFSAQITATGANTIIQLEPSQPALLRMGSGANPTNSMMTDAFPSGKALRIVQYGRTYFGQIIGATGAPGIPTVTLNATPPVQPWGSNNTCGVHPVGSNTLATVNVVNFIHYDLRNLAANAQTPQAKATYASLYNDSAAGPGEAQRTELVRIEQDVTGTAISGTEEIVAEYAVDLDLQLNAVTATLGVDPQVSTITSTDARFSTFTAPTFLGASTPELIRSVRVRLGVRSREGDRANTVADPTGNGLFRFNLGTGGAGTIDSYARVRTFQADIALHNQADVLW